MQILTIAIIVGIITQLLKANFARFITYNQQGVEIVLDRETGLEHLIYKGEVLK